MAYRDPHLHEKQRDCAALYMKHEGACHDTIEREMRQLGWVNFNRRSLYARCSRGRYVPGWPEALGWDEILKERLEMSRNQAEYTRWLRRHDPSRWQQVKPQAASTGDPKASFEAWVKRLWPTMDWDASHLRLLYRKLQLVTSGECKRLLITMPPRHGKSETVTVRYTAWRMRNDPALKVIIAGYGQRLSNRFSRGIRRSLQDDFVLRVEDRRAAAEAAEARKAEFETLPYSASEGTTAGPADVTTGCISTQTVRATHDPDGDEDPFPFTRPRPKNTEAEWETSKGGGLRAVGVGSGVTGFGAHLVVIDDPIKSRAEAESQEARDRVWNWFTDDIYTRLEPNAAVILIQTRWHEDDLAGRLLRQAEEEGSEKWEVLSMPALFDPKEFPELMELEAGTAAEPQDLSLTQTERHSLSANRVAEPPGRSGDLIEKHSLSARRAAEPQEVPAAHAEEPSLGNLASSPSRSLNEEANGSTAALPPYLRKSSAFPTAGPLIHSGSAPDSRPAAEPQRVLGARTERHSLSANRAAEPREVSGPRTEKQSFSADRAAAMPADKSDPKSPADSIHLNKSTDSTNPENSENSENAANFPNSENSTSLWPKRFSVDQLQEIRRQLGTYTFESLYQQNPVPADGGMFRREWFRDCFISAAPPGLRWVRAYDLAVTAGARSDFTASFAVAMDRGGVLYIDGGFRARIEYPAQRRYILGRIADEPLSEHVIEATHNGKAIVQDIRDKHPRDAFRLRAVSVRDPKIARAVGWISLVESGHFKMVRGAWNEAFIEEACSFPAGTHDDQIDAVSLAVSQIRRRARAAWAF